MVDHGDSDGDSSEENCIQDMLGGGIDFSAVWKEEENNNIMTPGLVDPSSIKRSRPVLMPCPTTSSRATDNNDDEYDIFFQNAFQGSGYCIPNHKVERPPLKIHDSGSSKGRALFATRFIPKGEVIYTERVAVATQVPVSLEDGRNSVLPVLACQQCHRSLEGWTKLLPVTKEGGEGSVAFPFPELWPVIPLNFLEAHSDDEDTRTAIRQDKYGRVQCEDCGAVFCANHCYETEMESSGSCCWKSRLMEKLPLLFGDNHNFDNPQQPLQAPPVLASVLFVELVQFYRTHGQSLNGHWSSHLCGDADDLQQLELGIHMVSDSAAETAPQYTLKPVYDYMAQELLQLNATEKETLSLELLHSLASKAARNGVGLSTQSPFKAYYAGLLRQTNYGGRSSDVHRGNMENLAKVLGKEGLERGMDQDIDALVAPQINGFFPLTACCNHSCKPNAQIQSQVFDDAHIDVVALVDIHQGEEVCISYIGRRSNRFQRQKELRARYLFQCKCELCREDIAAKAD